MPLSFSDTEDRITRLRHQVLHARNSVCVERAVLWTKYFEKRKNCKKPAVIQAAEALSKVLREKTIVIYPDEIIVGNYTSKRVGGSIYPELHGIPVLEDLFAFSKRTTNSLEICGRDIWQLIKIIPFWIFRFLAFKAYRSPLKKIRFIVGQLTGRYYVINESGGIAHVAPDYEKLIRWGIDGIFEEVDAKKINAGENSPQYHFYTAVEIVAEALAGFGKKYADLAVKMAAEERSAERKIELERIAETCRHIPQKPARNFQEAVQTVLFAQIALNLESLDNGISPGRLDQYLYPYCKRDVIEKKELSRQEAKELLAAFCIKTSEIIPVFSSRLTRIHGGLPSGQSVTVGGLDAAGCDATNELSYLFLEVINELRMRQPNFHSRLCEHTPPKFQKKVFEMIADGANSPALYGDESIINIMREQGYSEEDARNYTPIGCVEPGCQGKSFGSTDAALFNTPIILELSLNRGKRFGSILRTGVKTKPASKMKSMEEVKEAFERQLECQIEMLRRDLHAIESVNRDHHPTPMTSMLLDGCIEGGKCSTAGGARYNFSGIQSVGPSDTGDSLYAIEKAVFIDKKISLQRLVQVLKKNFSQSEDLRAYLCNLSKFGNDHEEVDRYTRYVIETFNRFLVRQRNTRGGRYLLGLYSMTAHQHFGRMTSATPNGRKGGGDFTSGISAGYGMDKEGPTALINSMNRIDFKRAANGVNFNMKLNSQCVRGQTGVAALSNMIKTYFKRGGMQVQINVFDPEVLTQAKNDPSLYPNLMVRISGYSAYFNDLTEGMKDEVIRRTLIEWD